ncbi:putative membrane protein [Kineococcus radiotolerans]|uniref:Putative membrane protein n=1 Tax=Kineococcus radiotolerans TaxID=131568 RepID=A0A7W4TLM3_KINRA|nr:YibE/F family protein [Kineococcus radiotolerans]MBB2901075.1 putative membrane protein [Kineococcus radiotolerans]
MEHSHQHAAEPPAPLPRRTRDVLTAVVLAVLVVAAAGIVATWPRDVPSASTGYVGAQTVRGEVTGTRMHTCRAELAEERLPDGTMPGTVQCPDATVAVDGAGSVTVPVPAAVFHGGLGPGDRVALTRYPAEAGAAEAYVWEDFDRRLPLAVVLVVFVLFTVLVGRRRGVAALVGLGLGGAAIAFHVVPALLTEQNAVVVGLSSSTAVMGVVIYLTHGLSARTTVAYLGTVAGLLVTAVAAVLAVDGSHLAGLDDESSYTVTVLTGAVDLRGVVLAGTLVAALGLLNDVTITQAAAVWEVRAAAPHAGFRDLFAAGMRVGRDHLASTVYTVTFAYAGAALPTLLLVRLYDQPAGQLLNSSAIAEELVRSAVGGIALAVTVPVTTALAAALVARSPVAPGAGEVTR